MGALVIRQIKIFDTRTNETIKVPADSKLRVKYKDDQGKRHQNTLNLAEFSTSEIRLNGVILDSGGFTMLFKEMMKKKKKQKPKTRTKKGKK